MSWEIAAWVIGGLAASYLLVNLMFALMLIGIARDVAGQIGQIEE